MNATLICYSCAIVGNDGARKKTLLNKLPMYKILKVTRMCVSSMRMEDCGTQEADQAVTRGAKAVTQGVVVNFSQMSNRHFGLPRGVNQRYSTDLNNTPRAHCASKAPLLLQVSCDLSPAILPFTVWKNSS